MKNLLKPLLAVAVASSLFGISSEAAAGPLDFDRDSFFIVSAERMFGFNYTSTKTDVTVGNSTSTFTNNATGVSLLAPTGGSAGRRGATNAQWSLPSSIGCAPDGGAAGACRTAAAGAASCPGSPARPGPQAARNARIAPSGHAARRRPWHATRGIRWRAMGATRRRGAGRSPRHPASREYIPPARPLTPPRASRVPR